jgi:hypothetical protein
VAERLVLRSAIERLAAQVALFGLMQPSEDDDLTAVSKFSAILPDSSMLSRTQRDTILRCAQSPAAFSSSRDTNLNIDNLNLGSGVAPLLQSAVSRVVDLSRSLFEGEGFSAKIYLRTSLTVDNVQSEILVSVAKYPLETTAADTGQSGLGSSWVKARGNPSIVWRCLETAQPVVEARIFPDARYQSVYAVCLPGRIGVLAITSEYDKSFEGRSDTWTTRSLSTAADVLVRRAFNI